MSDNLSESLLLLAREVHELHKAIRNDNNKAVLDRIAVMEGKIMASQAEQTAILRQVETKLNSANTTLGKIAGETDTLIQTVKDLKAALENQSNASQELVDAVAAVDTAATAVNESAGGVDAKVEDAPEPPTP